MSIEVIGRNIEMSSCRQVACGVSRAQTLPAMISGEEREEEGSGDSEQDVVGSGGMLAEPTRLKQHVIYGTISALSA